MHLTIGMTFAFSQQRSLPPFAALRNNWRHYAIEGSLLGTFMISACFFTAIFVHPDSRVARSIHSDLLRRALIGGAMGLTAICLIYSPWGKRSGAQMNPAMTLSFLRLGKMNPWDAIFYVAAQCLGAALGVTLCAMIAYTWLAHPSVKYVTTTPGAAGLAAAWMGEFVIAMFMISMVMLANRNPRLARFTGCFAGCLVALYITFEAPLSGMSLNPARTFGSAINANIWIGWWIYLTAPVCGMFAGIELLSLFGHSRAHLCGKLTHSRKVACLIRCNCIQHAD
jgi:aquaporin Z